MSEPTIDEPRTHELARETYQPDPLPDYDVFGAVIDATWTSLGAHTQA